ncbi:MAG: cold-shock protein [Hymenobacteraceae bacterium]|nr:cold-shock protein [Hymenobacteraceae bacterium]MDX5421311.1 cold-shock protein [Hymenobacteraceae bacterium]
MSRSQNHFMKRQREKKKQKKKDEKAQRKQERQENSTGGKLEDMIAYVDEFGNITSTPPEERSEEDKTEDEASQV